MKTSCRQCPIIFILLLLSLCLLQSSAIAASDDQYLGKEHEFRLKFIESGVSLYKYVGDSPEGFVFKKEPDFSSDEVVRSSLKIGPNKDDRIGYALDEESRMLYVDLNRNLDLTDDPKGVFHGKISTNTRDFQYAHTTYERVTLDFLHDGIHHKYIINIEDCDYKIHYYYILSGWSGEIELAGVKRTLTVIDDMDGKINFYSREYGYGDGLLLGYAEHDFVRDGDWRDPRWLNPREYLFFDGHMYKLAFSFEGGDKLTDLLVTFTEVPVELGELEINGEYISRLTIGKHLKMSAIIDRPHSKVKVPIGLYPGINVHMCSPKTPKTFYR